jgi:RES domain-containing protein
MLSNTALRSTLNALAQSAPKSKPFVSFRLVFFQYTTDALNPVGSLRGGRFNPKNQAALYTSLEPETALAERLHYFRSSPLIQAPLPPHGFVTVNSTLKRVLDLADPAVLRVLKTTPAELQEEWFPYTKQGKLSPSQRLGAINLEHALFDGFLAPSARYPGTNLVIYPTLLEPLGGEITLFDDQNILGRSSFPN